jgi:hypothetical protein
MVLSFRSESGRLYRLESSTDLQAPAWTPTGESLSGDGSVLDLYHDTDGPPHRTFRIVVD